VAVLSIEVICYVHVIMKNFLVGSKRDLSHHVRYGMRVGWRPRERYPVRRSGLAEILLRRAVNRQIRDAQRSMATWGKAKPLRSWMRREGYIPSRHEDHFARLRREAIEATEPGREAFRNSAIARGIMGAGAAASEVGRRYANMLGNAVQSVVAGAPTYLPLYMSRRNRAIEQ
jgi:hypothetical protein